MQRNQRVVTPKARAIRLALTIVVVSAVVAIMEVSNHESGSVITASVGLGVVVGIATGAAVWGLEIAVRQRQANAGKRGRSA